jgi:hypothetical protein
MVYIWLNVAIGRIGPVMSDEFDREFGGAADAKAEIRAAVRYLLKGAAGSDRGDIVREIIAIVSEVARGLAPVSAKIPSTMSCRVADSSPSMG